MPTTLVDDAYGLAGGPAGLQPAGMIDVAVAMRRERACLERALSGHPSEAMPNLMALGIGGQSAGRWASSLEGRRLPAMLLSMGFAGGLASDCRPGDVVLAERLVADGEAETFQSDPQLLALALRACRETGMAHCVGDALTVGMAVCHADLKARLGRETGAVACSMEDYWLAREAHRRGVPFLAARVVLDPVAQDLPPFIPGLAHSAGPALAVKALAGASLHWRSIPALIVLARQAGLAQRRLGAFAASLWPRLLAADSAYSLVSSVGLVSRVGNDRGNP